MNFQFFFIKVISIIYESFSWIPDIFCCDKIEREECNISVLPRKYNTWQYQPDGYFYWVITRTLDIYDNKYSILTIILFRPTLCVSQENKHFETARWPPSPFASRLPIWSELTWLSKASYFLGINFKFLLKCFSLKEKLH